MRPLPLLAAALLTFAGPAFAAATVDKVVVHGLDNELMRQNVELALSINNESGKRLGESRLEFLLREAQAEAREALEPFGYYSPEISVDAPRNGGDNDHLTVTLTIRLGDPVRVRQSNLKIEGEGNDDQYLQTDLGAFRPQIGEVLDHTTYEASRNPAGCTVLGGTGTGRATARSRRRPDVRGDAIQVGQWTEMAGAELFVTVGAAVARFDRHRDAARAEAACCGNHDLCFEHEAFAGYVVQRHHRFGIEALATLAVGHLVAGTPGQAPVAELVRQLPVQRLLRALAQACADDDAAGVAIRRIQQTRQVAGRMLAIAVHGQHALEATLAGFAEAIPQRLALAFALSVAQQDDRHEGPFHEEVTAFPVACSWAI